jgi:prevent-host-death family protein
MKEVAISVFKAKCMGILEEVRKTRKPIRVTRFGKPVAEVVPPSTGETGGRRLGCGAGGTSWGQPGAGMTGMPRENEPSPTAKVFDLTLITADDHLLALTGIRVLANH